MANWIAMDIDSVRGDRVNPDVSTKVGANTEHGNTEWGIDALVLRS